MIPSCAVLYTMFLSMEPFGARATACLAAHLDAIIVEDVVDQVIEYVDFIPMPASL